MNKLLINGIEMAFVDRGEGAPVLLVHGFPLDHRMWEAQIEALSAHFRVIAPDLRGFGQSEIDSDDIGMQQYADDLAALLDALKISQPVALVGLSMGGYIAFAFANQYAARVGALVLCDTRAVADTSEVAANRRESAKRVIEEGHVFIADMMLPKLLARQTQEEKPELATSLYQMMLGAPSRGVTAALRGMASRPDRTDCLKDIKSPTLVVVGQHDVISTADEMRTIAKAIPNAQLAVIPGAGHMSPCEKPDKVNETLLHFLKSR